MYAFTLGVTEIMFYESLFSYHKEWVCEEAGTSKGKERLTFEIVAISNMAQGQQFSYCVRNSCP